MRVAARRAKALPKVPDPELEQMLERDADKGMSTALADTAFWLPDIDDPDSAAWYAAFEAVDKHGDKTALLALLGAGKQPPLTVLPHLRDLLERYNLKRRRGKQRTPSYNRTSRQAMMELALASVRAAVRHGMSVKKAVDKYAGNGITEETLSLAYSGRHGGMRRVGGKRQRKKK